MHVLAWNRTSSSALEESDLKRREKGAVITRYILQPAARRGVIAEGLGAIMGFDKIFLLLIGSVLGYIIGTSRFQKYHYVRGFFDGWIARHQGRGIPAEYTETYTPLTDVLFALSAAERELLKDPDERRWRRLPPLEEGK